MRNSLVCVWEKGTQHTRNNIKSQKTSVSLPSNHRKRHSHFYHLFCKFMDDQDTITMIGEHRKIKRKGEKNDPYPKMTYALGIRSITGIACTSFWFESWILFFFYQNRYVPLEDELKNKSKGHVRCPEDRHYSVLIESTKTKIITDTQIKRRSKWDHHFFWGCYSREIDVFHSL